MYAHVVLCVDDRPKLLKLRKGILESCGYSVMIATSVANAIKTLETASIAVVLVDYKSEDLDAQAVAYHIKQRYPYQPIILLSAYSDMPELESSATVRQHRSEPSVSREGRAQPPR